MPPKRNSKCLWTPAEDRMLFQLAEQHNRAWDEVSSALQGRSAKQCRERWNTHVKPGIRKDAWTAQEDERLLDLVSSVGPQWRQIADYFPGRTNVGVKNRYFWFVRRNLVPAPDTWKFSIPFNVSSRPNSPRAEADVATPPQRQVSETEVAPTRNLPGNHPDRNAAGDSNGTTPLTTPEQSPVPASPSCVLLAAAVKSTRRGSGQASDQIKPEPSQMAQFSLSNNNNNADDDDDDKSKSDDDEDDDDLAQQRDSAAELMAASFALRHLQQQTQQPQRKRQRQQPMLPQQGLPPKFRSRVSSASGQPTSCMSNNYSISNSNTTTTTSTNSGVRVAPEPTFLVPSPVSSGGSHHRSNNNSGSPDRQQESTPPASQRAFSTSNQFDSSNQLFQTTQVYERLAGQPSASPSSAGVGAPVVMSNGSVLQPPMRHRRFSAFCHVVTQSQPAAAHPQMAVEDQQRRTSLPSLQEMLAATLPPCGY